LRYDKERKSGRESMSHTTKYFKNLRIESIRYFKTRRGLGYEAKTDKGSIWNDGNGGCTYFEPRCNKDGSIPVELRKYRTISEWDLEKLIDIHEGV